MHDAAPCHCTLPTLPTTTLAALQAAYTGCLCGPCLRAVAAGAPGTGAGP